MHPTLRLLTARLPPFSPTGLTGILTHPNPRPTLVALYNHTLTLLAQLPSHSVYRQSTENLTRHRLSMVEAVKPDGYEAYRATLEAAKEAAGVKGKQDTAFELDVVITQARAMVEGLEEAETDRSIMDYLAAENRKWGIPIMPKSAPVGDSEAGVKTGELEGEKAQVPPMGETFVPEVGGGKIEAETAETPLLPMEPELTAEQVGELEEKIGGGLIEEVIDQGWMELKLIGDMEAAKVWEQLEFVPEEGQWVGFERKP